MNLSFQEESCLWKPRKNQGFMSVALGVYSLISGTSGPLPRAGWWRPAGSTTVFCSFRSPISPGSLVATTGYTISGPSHRLPLGLKPISTPQKASCLAPPHSEVTTPMPPALITVLFYVLQNPQLPLSDLISLYVPQKGGACIKPSCQFPQPPPWYLAHSKCLRNIC